MPLKQKSTNLAPAKSTGRGSKFEVFKDKRGQTRFRYRAGNGEIVFSSEGYVTKASALKAIEQIRTHAGNATVQTVAPSLAEYLLAGPAWDDEFVIEINRRSASPARTVDL